MLHAVMSNIELPTHHVVFNIKARLVNINLHRKDEHLVGPSARERSGSRRERSRSRARSRSSVGKYRDELRSNGNQTPSTSLVNHGPESPRPESAPGAPDRARRVSQVGLDG